MKKCLFGGVDIAPPWANIGLLLLRVFTGLALLFQHGLHKMPPSPRFIERVSGLGFPLPELFAGRPALRKPLAEACWRSAF